MSSSRALLKRSLQIVDESNDHQNKIKSLRDKTHLIQNRRTINKVTKKQQTLKLNEAAKNKKPKNIAEENVKKLLKLSSVQLDDITTKKILRRAQINKEPIPQNTTGGDDNSKSVFTEEDFREFERTYFCS